MISRPLLVIHTSLALLLPLVIALLVSGCKPKEEGFGPEVDVASIQAELAKSFAEYDPNTMKVGEWAQLDQTQQLNGEVYLISDMAQSIVSREDDELEATFRTVENRRFFDRQMKVTKQVDTEFAVKWKFAPSSAAISQQNTSDLFGDPIYRINQDIREMQAARSDGSMTYHNLRTSMTLEKPPGDIGTEQIRVYTIKFDMVFWQSGKGDKLIREYRLSPDVPYLGAVLSECLTGLVPIENSRVFVKECTESKNFRLGTGSSPTP